MTNIKTSFSNLLSYLQSKSFLTIQNLIILIVSFGIFYSPFVVDFKTLPKGYELPKVLFWQIIALIIIFLFLISLLYSLFSILKTTKLKNLTLPKDAYFLALLIFFYFVSSIISPFQNIAWLGNEFRLQGFVTNTLIIVVGYIVYKCVNKRNWHLIALSFIFSSLIQAIIGFSQFSNLAKTNPAAILDGLWVNGTFGQSNWFAGRLLIGVIFAAFYLSNFLIIKNKQKNLALNIVIRIIFILIIFVLLTAMGFSLSEWALTSVGIAIILLCLYEIFNHQIFAYILRASIIGGIILGIVFVKINTDYNFRLDIWQSILNIMFEAKFNFEVIKRLIFGYGFDTLGEVFKTFSSLKGSLVDRAHNFLLDIFVQNGLAVLSLFGYLIYLINKKLKDLLVDRKSAITLIALLIWMFRSLVHESGIVNLVDFLVIFGCVISFTQKKQVEVN